VTGELEVAGRATFGALADVLLPAVDGLPAPTAIDVQGRWLDRALAARPDLTAPLEAILVAAGGLDAAAEARRLRAEQPEAFAVLALLVTGAYYLSPTVRRRIGYPGQKADPAPDDEADYWLRDGILEPVAARGPRWRRPADAPAERAGGESGSPAHR
jgi:hypothetical protein